METCDTEVTDDNQPKERFTLREPHILLSIILLSVLNGITAAVELTVVVRLTKRIELVDFQNLCYVVVSVPAIIMFAFLSEITGRKPIFVALCALSLLASILAMIPPNTPLLRVEYIIQGIVDGGVPMMGMITIPEYCSPRHRFVYIIANGLARMTGFTVLFSCVNGEVVREIYFKLVGIVLGLGCVACACAWPESPYWLAAHGRGGEAARTLRSLRGGDAGPELRQLNQEHRTPGPPRLFWLSLFFVLAIASVKMFSNWLNVLLSIIHGKNSFISSNLRQVLLCVCNITLLSLISLASYKAKRKVIYVVSCIVALGFSYILVVWLYLEQTEHLIAFHVFLCFCQLLLTCGPQSLSVALVIEVMPQKYNTVMACICYVLVYLGHFCLGIFLTPIARNLSNYIYVLLFATLSLPGVIVVFFLVPETKGKTLLEIQKSYIPEQAIGSPEQGQIVLQNISSQVKHRRSDLL